MINKDVYLQQRRNKFLLAINNDNNSIAIIFAARDLPNNRKTISPYRQNSDLYYLTGFPEPEAVAVFIPNRPEGEFILFCQDKDPQLELWTGRRIGLEKAQSEYGAAQAFPVKLIDQLLPQLINGREIVYFNDVGDINNYKQVISWINLLPNQERKGNNKPNTFIDTAKVLHEMRLRKDEQEIELLRSAAQITAAAAKRIMQVCRPGMMEYELEAEVTHEFLRSGGRMASFEPIIAGGANGCVLHYTNNDMPLKDGDLVLADIGVEYKYYAGDVTRTFPVNGKFNPQQRAIYQAVLNAQLAVIASIKPGITWKELHTISEKNITENLVKIGLLHGDVHELWQKQAFKPFYMHFISHWLGMDVHDVGSYNTKNGWRKLESGMLLSAEPGIYIAAGTPNVDEKWWNIAVRIEDDILVTADGCEILSKDAPKNIDEIELIMKK